MLYSATVQRIYEERHRVIERIDVTIDAESPEEAQRVLEHEGAVGEMDELGNGWQPVSRTNISDDGNMTVDLVQINVIPDDEKLDEVDYDVALVNQILEEMGEEE